MFNTSQDIVANGGFFSLFNLPSTVFDWNVLTRLAAVMSDTQLPGSSRMDSGLVYLGQFITHDVTRLRLPEPPRAFVPAFDLLQDRSPALDLDHVYGRGWGYAYDAIDHETGKMFLGWTVDAQQRPVATDDLPRRPDRSARIPDDRNDENLLLAQLHVQFLKMHNMLVDRIRQVERIADPQQLFERARSNLILYYQQVVLYDFLEAILDPVVWQYVIRDNRGTLWTPVRAELARVPVEFSAAAFRFAHAMVRSSYTVNDRRSVAMAELFQMTGSGGFADHAALPHTHVVDWRMFFADPRRGDVPFFNNALPIDPTVLVGSPQAPQMAMVDLRTSNRSLLADAQTIIAHIERAHPALYRHIRLEPLSQRDLNPEVTRGTEVRGLLDFVENNDLSRKTPLWYYVLAEAHALYRGDRLGPLGSLLVAETLRALVSLSSPSILAGDLPGMYVIPSGNAAAEPHVRMIDLLAAVAESSVAAAVFRPDRHFPPAHTNTRPTPAVSPQLETQS
jgi:hypothetical protein